MSEKNSDLYNLSKKTINGIEDVNVYILNESILLYRGDNNITDVYDNEILSGDFKFFTPDQQAAEQYGVVYEFKPKKQLHLVALDNISENLYNSLIKEPDAEDILKNNYGYISKKRKSDSKPDKRISEILCERGFDGYAINKMEILNEGGTFHKEVVICKPRENVVVIRQVTTEEEKQKILQEKKEKEINKPKRKTKNEERPNSGFEQTQKKLLFSFDDSDSDNDEKQNINVNLFGNDGGKQKKILKKTYKHKKSKKNKKTKRQQKNKKGGDSDQKGNFIPFENIDNKAICPICQDPLKLENEEQIIEKGIVYQLSCGHQFHNNCLKGWCKTITNNANKGLSEDERIFRLPEIFKCPICGQKTLKEEEDCTSVNELYPIGKLSKEYGSEKYTGLKPKTIFDRFFKGGKTKKNKTKKNKKQKKTVKNKKLV